MTAVFVNDADAYEQFVLAWPPAEWFVERVPPDAKIGARLEGWKQLRRDGWDLTVLMALDNSHIIAFGCRYG